MPSFHPLPPFSTSTTIHTHRHTHIFHILLPEPFSSPLTFPHPRCRSCTLPHRYYLATNLDDMPSPDLGSWCPNDAPPETSWWGSELTTIAESPLLLRSDPFDFELDAATLADLAGRVLHVILHIYEPVADIFATPAEGSHRIACLSRCCTSPGRPSKRFPRGFSGCTFSEDHRLCVACYTLFSGCNL